MMRAAGLVLGAGILWLSACTSTGGIALPGLTGGASDEEQIAAIMNDIETGLETKRVYKVLSYVAESYQDKDGRDYEAVRTFLIDNLKNYREIDITRPPPQIRVQDDQARVIETFGMIGEPFDRNEAPPINLQGTVPVFFQRLDGKWRIVGLGPLQ